MKIGIVGATGSVGQALLSLLLKEKFCEPQNIKLFASHRSQEKVFEYDENFWLVEKISEELKNFDILFLCCPPDVSREVVALAKDSVNYIIDGSPAFRLDENVPLIIPEINGHEINSVIRFVASPNCTTTIALMALYPLHKRFILKRFWASSYQAVSGIGNSGIEELNQQLNTSRPCTPQFFPRQIAHNIIPQVGRFFENEYETEEETKLRLEAKKILSLKNLKVSATCVRVPVFRAHSISIQAEFEKTINLEEAEKVLKKFPGITFHKEKDQYPTPVEYEKQSCCAVGRLRKDEALDNGLALWVVGDQLLKGAALNMLQIFKRLQGIKA